jgi:hypothetical protein
MDTTMREFRTGYFSAPCDADRLRKPSYVQCRVDVTMPPSSARTGKAMLHPLSKFPAHATSLRRVGGVNKCHSNGRDMDIQSQCVELLHAINNFTNKVAFFKTEMPADIVKQASPYLDGHFHRIQNYKQDAEYC